MKNKIILSLSFVLFIFSLSYSQGVRIGLKGGANLSQITGGESADKGYNASYHAGIFAEIDFTKKIGIQPEILYSQTKTHVISNLGGIFNGFGSVNLNYLSVPVLLRISAGDMLTFVVGPQFSILVNKNETELQNASDAFKNGDFAMVAGLQVNLKMLRVYARYVAGLSNINNISNSDTWTNRQIQLGIGLRLVHIH